MDNGRRAVIIVASVVVGLALLGFLMESTGAGEVGVFFLAPAALLFNPLTLIIILIVVLVRRRGGGQQQQQQVVVVTGGQQANAGSPRLRCPKCSGLSKADARFCGQCGASFG